MLFFGTFIEVEFIEEGVSARSESKLNQPLLKVIKQTRQMSPHPLKMWGGFVIIIFPFSAYVITILFSCVYHEKSWIRLEQFPTYFRNIIFFIYTIQ